VKPLVTFADPEAAVIGYLNNAFIGPLAGRKPTTIKTDPPSTNLGASTHVQVELDASFTQDLPATERATVRVTCHAGAGHRSDVKALASLVQGLLTIHPGDANVFGTRPLVGRSGIITDPATKNLMVWFSFRVNMRPTAV
jgi:hypothetical protein